MIRECFSCTSRKTAPLEAEPDIVAVSVALAESLADFVVGLLPLSGSYVAVAVALACATAVPVAKAAAAAVAGRTVTQAVRVSKNPGRFIPAFAETSTVAVALAEHVTWT